ncbi:MAG: NAD(P)/FAD-dependent oxidoreductase [Terracidiphilus sp.]
MSVPARWVENLVIGGGPAGAMAAIKLAEAGREVVLVEKESEPHDKVCGEFLSQEAIGYLGGVSVFLADLGAQPIQTVRLYSGSRCTESALPFPALGLSRRVLDAALLVRAAAAGCEVQRGVAVDKLIKLETGWSAKLSSGAWTGAQTVFLASGKHDLHGWNRPRGTQSDLVGFKLHWRLRRAQIEALRGSTELFLFTGGYGGMLLVENETANLCLVAGRSTLRRHEGWSGLLAAIVSENRELGRRLMEAEALHARPLAISPIPYGYLSRTSEGLWRIGDQAGVIPSFTGDGISIALHSASLATRMHLLGRTPHEYISMLHGQLRQSMRLATCLSRAMVTAPCRGAAPAVLSFVPGTMRFIAAATRIPRSATDLVKGMPQGLKPASI